MKLHELPEDFIPDDFMKLDKSELDLMPYEIFKWECCFKGCTGGTTVRDYGIRPFFFLNRNSKRSEKSPELYWLNINERIWFCGKHYPYYKRLGWKYIENKYFEYKELSINPLKNVNQNIQQLG